MREPFQLNLSKMCGVNALNLSLNIKKKKVLYLLFNLTLSKYLTSEVLISLPLK